MNLFDTFYCPSEDCSCPYYNCKSGLCALGKKSAPEECDDAWALCAADYMEDPEPEEIYAVYDPDD